MAWVNHYILRRMSEMNGKVMLGLVVGTLALFLLVLVPACAGSPDPATLLAGWYAGDGHAHTGL